MFLVAAFASMVCIQAQDVITKRNGDEILAKILEVNPTEIKYKRYDNPDGPLYVILKNDVLFVKYENGTNEVFDQESVSSYDSSSAQISTDYGTTGKVYPGCAITNIKIFMCLRPIFISPATGMFRRWAVSVHGLFQAWVK